MQIILCSLAVSKEFLIQDVGMDHHRAVIPMTEQLLDRPDIVTLFYPRHAYREAGEGTAGCGVESGG